MDVVHTAAKAIDYNRYASLATLIIVVCAVMFYTGCESTTASLTAPSEKVSRAEFEAEAVEAGVDFATREALIVAQVAALNAEISAHNTLVESGRKDLDRQDELMAAIIGVIGQTADAAASDTLSFAKVIPWIVGLAGMALGTGGVVLAGATKLDKSRADKVIVNLKEEAKA